MILLKNFSQYLGVDHTVGVANGTDALVLCLKCLGVSEAMKLSLPKTYLASASSIHLVGAKSIFVILVMTIICALILCWSQLQIKLKPLFWSLSGNPPKKNRNDIVIP